MRGSLQSKTFRVSVINKNFKATLDLCDGTGPVPDFAMERLAEPVAVTLLEAGGAGGSVAIIGESDETVIFYGQGQPDGEGWAFDDVRHAWSRPAPERKAVHRIGQ